MTEQLITSRRVLNATEARQDFSDLVEDVASGKYVAIIERRGQPRAALVSLAQLEVLEGHLREHYARPLDFSDLFTAATRRDFVTYTGKGKAMRYAGVAREIWADVDVAEYLRRERESW